MSWIIVLSAMPSERQREATAHEKSFYVVFLSGCMLTQWAMANQIMMIKKIFFFYWNHPRCVSAARSTRSINLKGHAHAFWLMIAISFARATNVAIVANGFRDDDLTVSFEFVDAKKKKQKCSQTKQIMTFLLLRCHVCIWCTSLV